MLNGKLDLVLGAVATGVGTTGAAVQLWGAAASATLVGLNIILACGGLYIVYLRQKKLRGEIEDNERVREQEMARNRDRSWAKDKPSHERGTQSSDEGAE